MSINKNFGIMLPYGREESIFFIDKLVEKKINITGYYSHSSNLPKTFSEQNIFINISKLYDSKTVKDSLLYSERYEEDPNFNLQKMYECEHYFMSTMDRLSIKPQSINSRKDLFRELCFIFSKVFYSGKVSHVCFSATPHFGWDLVCFFVAKYYKVETIILHKTDSSNIYFFKSDWRYEKDLKKNIPTFNDPSETVELFSQEESNHIKAIRKNFKHITHKKNIFSLVKLNLVIYLRYIKFFLEIIMTKRITIWHDSSFYCNQNINKFEKIYYYIKNINIINKKIKKYNLLCTEPDFKKKYIFFALHDQPERTSQPEGIEFSDQILAIKQLASKIPEEFVIYVKEHPSHFTKWPPENSAHRYNERLGNYYQEISCIKNVKLINYKIDSKLLIRNSICIATITGSVGWEALKIGKPCITFGYPWYSSCDSNLKFLSSFSKNILINFINSKSQEVVKKDVFAFLHLFQPHCFKSMPIQWVKNDKIDRNKLANNYVKNLVYFIKP